MYQETTIHCEGSIKNIHEKKMSNDRKLSLLYISLYYFKNRLRNVSALEC